jgi:hypothetical protein
VTLINRTERLELAAMEVLGRDLRDKIDDMPAEGNDD